MRVYMRELYTTYTWRRLIVSDVACNPRGHRKHVINTCSPRARAQESCRHSASSLGPWSHPTVAIPYTVSVRTCVRVCISVRSYVLPVPYTDYPLVLFHPHMSSNLVRYIEDLLSLSPATTITLPVLSRSNSCTELIIRDVIASASRELIRACWCLLRFWDRYIGATDCNQHRSVVLCSQGPPQPSQQYKYTIAESCDRIKEDYNILQAQYHAWVTHT